MSIARPVPAVVAPEREALAGLVERVTFHNPENGFCVLRVKVRGQRDLVTVVGAAAAISAGEFVQASGHLGQRPHARAAVQGRLPQGRPADHARGHRAYLGSGMIKGIGPVYAEQAGRRPSARPCSTSSSSSPSACRRSPGSAPSGPSAIVEGWAEQKVIREIMLFLHGHGVGTSRAVRIFKTYGADAVQVITENPYRLARDIRGIGFKSADQIAARLGIEKTAMIRARAGICYALAEAMDEGHCGLPTRRAARRSPPSCWRSRPRWSTRRSRWSSPTGGWWPTRSTSAPACSWPGCTGPSAASPSGCCALAEGRPPWPAIDADKALAWVEPKTGIALAREPAGGGAPGAARPRCW